MKCKGEISGSCHSTYSPCRRIGESAGEGLCSTHIHPQAAWAGRGASLFPSQ